MEQPLVEPLALAGRLGGATRADRRHQTREIECARTHELGHLLARQLALQFAPRLDDGAVRDTGRTDIDAGATHDLHPLFVGEPHRLGDEATLADPGLPGQQDGRRRPLTRRAESIRDRGELCRAPDDDRTDEPGGHGVDDRGGHGVHGKMAIHRVTANEAAATTFDARWDLAAERALVPRRASRINRACPASRWNSAIRSWAVISAKQAFIIGLLSVPTAGLDPAS